MSSNADDPVAEFAAAARAFLRFISDLPSESETSLLPAFNHLSAIQFRYAGLPAATGNPEDWGYDLSSWSVNTTNLHKTYYWEVFDPRIIEGQRVEDLFVAGDLGDDLVDIAADLAGGLATFESNRTDATQEALLIWHQSYRAHWGEHLLGALRYLYFALYRDAPDAFSAG